LDIDAYLQTWTQKRKTKYTNTNKKKVRCLVAINERLSNLSPIVIPCLYIHYFSPNKLLRKQKKKKKKKKMERRMKTPKLGKLTGTKTTLSLLGFLFLPGFRVLWTRKREKTKPQTRKRKGREKKRCRSHQSKKNKNSTIQIGPV